MIYLFIIASPLFLGQLLQELREIHETSPLVSINKLYSLGGDSHFYFQVIYHTITKRIKTIVKYNDQ